jgi:hypothetical protein
MYRTLPYQGGDARLVSEVVNNAMNGNTNNSGEITLNTGGATTTTLFNERIGFDSIILFAPLTIASAASNNYPYGTFEHQVTQTFTANTPTVADIATTEFAYGMSLGSNQITVDYAGIYNVEVSGLFVNNTNAQKFAWMWIRVNGVDVPHSATKLTVPVRHDANIYGYIPVTIHHPLDLDVDDYVEIMVAVEDVGVYLNADTAQTTPFAAPSIPSLMVNLGMIEPSETTGSAHEMYVSSRQKGSAVITHLPNNVADNTYGYIIVG